MVMVSKKEQCTGRNEIFQPWNGGKYLIRGNVYFTVLKKPGLGSKFIGLIKLKLPRVCMHICGQTTQFIDS